MRVGERPKDPIYNEIVPEDTDSDSDSWQGIHCMFSFVPTVSTLVQWIGRITQIFNPPKEEKYEWEFEGKKALEIQTPYDLTQILTENTWWNPYTFVTSCQKALSTVVGLARIDINSLNEQYRKDGWQGKTVVYGKDTPQELFDCFLKALGTTFASYSHTPSQHDKIFAANKLELKPIGYHRIGVVTINVKRNFDGLSCSRELFVPSSSITLGPVTYILKAIIVLDPKVNQYITLIPHHSPRIWLPGRVDEVLQFELVRGYTPNDLRLMSQHNSALLVYG